MNYYDILKVKRNATSKEIKASYKNLIKQYHPDIYAGDKAFAEYRTTEINIAYDVLSNSKLRNEYDSILEHKYHTPSNDYYNQKSYYKSDQTNTNYIESLYNNFSDNIVKKIEKLNITSKLILFSIFILVYILFFLINLLQFEKIHNKNYSSNTSNNAINISEFYNDE